MNRLAASFGLLLAGVAVAAPLTGAEGIPTWTLGLWLATLIAAALSFRGSHLGLVSLGILALVTLVRALPAFFTTGGLWPHVPYILLGTISMGLSVLAVVLDRFQGPEHQGPEGL